MLENKNEHKSQDAMMKLAEGKINGLFIFMGKLSETPSMVKATDYVYSRFEESLSNNKKFYSEEFYEARKNIAQALALKNKKCDKYIENLIKFEVASPFGVLNDLFELNIPDLIISNKVIKVQFSQEYFHNFYIPEEIHDAFKSMLNHFVNNQKFLNDSKLDRGNAIIDCSFEKFRMNLMHESLSNSSTPIITIRKHISGDNQEDITKLPGYITSTNVSKNQLETMKEYSDKSIVIFGTTGSAKTTMLRYLTNYGIDTKRNVCIIEDTPELFVKTGISLVTNSLYNIRDLFVAALRQNPSHLIIGETRTDEIIDILQAGLTFSVSTTIHATSFKKALDRIYFMSLPRKLKREDVNELVYSSIDMFIFMEDKKVKELWIKDEDSTENDISKRYIKVD